jgi:hypothetical protein
VAIKRVDLRRSSPAKVDAEVAALQRVTALRHRNLPRLLGAFRQASHVDLVLNICEGLCRQTSCVHSHSSARGRELGRGTLGGGSGIRIGFPKIVFFWGGFRCPLPIA